MHSVRAHLPTAGHSCGALPFQPGHTRPEVAWHPPPRPRPAARSAAAGAGMGAARTSSPAVQSKRPGADPTEQAGDLGGQRVVRKGSTTRSAGRKGLQNLSEAYGTDSAATLRAGGSGSASV